MVELKVGILVTPQDDQHTGGVKLIGDKNEAEEGCFEAALCHGMPKLRYNLL